MKKIKILVASLLIGSVAYSQAPTGTPGPGVNWRRGGNLAGPGAPNIFGTMWNSPIYTYTNGIARMIVNGDKTESVMGQPINTNGFVGINTTKPLTYLTISGPNNTPYGFGGGYRNWMKTGVFNSENSDYMYIGMKPEGFNRSDAIIAFGDDGNPNSIRNNLRFISTNPSTPNAGHLELGIFTFDGNFGVGPVFTNNTQPLSLVHLNRDKKKATWLQITNQYGTKQTANDGLRFGIRNGNNASAYLRWQEKTPFIIQTDWNNNPGGINNGERMRILSIGSLVGTPNYQGLTAPKNTTRVAISHSGSQPITRPMSLLHLGYNTGLSSFSGSSTDGWRKWMDIGTFTSNGTDNMYVGLKQEAGAFPLNDRNDAVINWGDNNGVNPLNGPDNLRFIFTQTTTGIGGTPPSNQPNGLEVARMQPNKASTLTAPNFGIWA